MPKRTIILAGLLCFAVAISILQVRPSQGDLIEKPQLVLNPYEGIDWSQDVHHKANLHTHTNQGGGQMSPAEVIDAYHELGYTILAITDHDNRGSSATTWPWEDYGRDPGQLGVVAIEGNELSYQHHIGSLFNDYSGSRFWGSVDRSLREIGQRAGLAIFYHPGRYNQPGDWRWYKPYFNKHDHLLGIEVFNQGDRYPRDRELWDNLLMNFMPDRSIWGFSNDDMHRRSQLGRNWNTLLLEELSEEAVRDALINGRFYMTYQPGHTMAPSIEDIWVDEKGITIKASEYEEIIWISSGEAIHAGETLDYKATPGIGNYVRAEIRGRGGITLTNPFGFRCENAKR